MSRQESDYRWLLCCGSRVGGCGGGSRGKGENGYGGGRRTPWCCDGGGGEGGEGVEGRRREGGEAGSADYAYGDGVWRLLVRGGMSERGRAGEEELASVGGWEVGHVCFERTSLMGGISCGGEEFGGKEERRKGGGEELAQGLSGAGMEHSFVYVHSVNLS